MLAALYNVTLRSCFKYLKVFKKSLIFVCLKSLAIAIAMRSMHAQAEALAIAEFLCCLLICFDSCLLLTPLLCLQLAPLSMRVTCPGESLSSNCGWIALAHAAAACLLSSFSCFLPSRRMCCIARRIAMLLH